MRNGLYSIHIHMLDGVKRRDSGVLILRDGALVSGGHLFLVGRQQRREWHPEGELATNQHAPFADPFVRPLFAGQDVTTGFSGRHA